MALTVTSAGSIVTTATWAKMCTIKEIPASCARQESRKIAIIFRKNTRIYDKTVQNSKWPKGKKWIVCVRNEVSSEEIDCSQSLSLMDQCSCSVHHLTKTPLITSFLLNRGRSHRDRGTFGVTAAHTGLTTTSLSSPTVQTKP